MNHRQILCWTAAATLLLGVGLRDSRASGTDEPGASLVSWVFPDACAPLAVGSPSFQMTVTVGEEGPIVRMGGEDVVLESGFQATHDGLDTDGDGIPDSLDDDDDGDGIPDGADGLPYDTDNDGMNNIAADDDDDGDDLGDATEAGFGTSLVKPDTDSDTQTDYEEWVAGTSGTDSNNLFRFSAIAAVVGGLTTRVDWAGVAGRSYELRSCTDLRAANWVYLTTTGVTANTAASLLDTTGGTTQKTYRLEVRFTPLRLVAAPGQIPVGQNTCFIRVETDVFSRAPYTWWVGDATLGNVGGTAGNTTTYTSFRQGMNAIYVTDADGRNGQISVEQL